MIFYVIGGLAWASGAMTLLAVCAAAARGDGRFDEEDRR